MSQTHTQIPAWQPAGGGQGTLEGLLVDAGLLLPQAIGPLTIEATRGTASALPGAAAAPELPDSAPPRSLMTLASLAKALRSEGVVAPCDVAFLLDEDLRRLGLTTVNLRKLQAAVSGRCGGGGSNSHATHSDEGAASPAPAAAGSDSILMVGAQPKLGARAEANPRMTNVKTFGCIHSEPFRVNGSEFTICEHTSSVPGAITHMQFTWSGDAQNVHFRA